MLNTKTIEDLNKAISAIKEYEEKNLIDRSEWGTVNFSTYSDDIEQLFDLVGTLSSQFTNIR